MNEAYATSDFCTIIFLFCNGKKFLNSRRVAPNRVEFSFDDKEECEKLVQKMITDDNVSLSRTMHEVKRVRQIIHTTP